VTGYLEVDHLSTAASEDESEAGDHVTDLNQVYNGSSSVGSGGYGFSKK
jgi:hypothetical protein